MVRRARWAAILLAALALSACVSAPVVTPHPAAGTCRLFSVAGPATLEYARSVDCSTEHGAETLHTGTFGSEALQVPATSRVRATRRFRP